VTVWWQVPLGIKLSYCCTLIQVFIKFKYSECDGLPIEKSKNRPDLCSRSTNEIFKEKRREKTIAVNSGITVLRDYVTIYNQRHQKFKKKEE
jgi:hypothetical protein